mgnify:CR=1 FL=1
MEDALSFDKVKNIVNETDRIAILGNSHSSALAIKNFIEASNVDRENIFVYRLSFSFDEENCLRAAYVIEKAANFKKYKK